MDFLKNLQDKPESVKKTILFSVLGIIGIILGVYFVFVVKNAVKEPPDLKFLMPDFSENGIEIPSFDLSPTGSIIEDIRKFEQEFEQLSEEEQEELLKEIEDMSPEEFQKILESTKDFDIDELELNEENKENIE